MKLEGLYAITDERLTPFRILPDAVRSALEGGARLIQLRDKHSSDDDLLPLADMLAGMCRDYEAVFIINDRVELAARCDCHGVHIGKDDIAYQDARAMLPDRIIGVSCYNDLDSAFEMQEKGADYVAFGSFFPSPTKPDAVRMSVDLLRKAGESLDIPVCAIGGITVENCSDLLHAGADMLAVISGLWNCGSIMDRAREFTRMFGNRDARIMITMES